MVPARLIKWAGSTRLVKLNKPSSDKNSGSIKRKLNEPLARLAKTGSFSLTSRLDSTREIKRVEFGQGFRLD